MKIRCSHISCKRQTRFICDKCGCVSYCSKFCRKRDRKRHALLCFPTLEQRIAAFFKLYYKEHLAIRELTEISIRKRRTAPVCVTCQSHPIFFDPRGFMPYVIDRFPMPPTVECRTCRDSGEMICRQSFFNRRRCFSRFVALVFGLKLPRDIRRLLFDAIIDNGDCVFVHKFD